MRVARLRCHGNNAKTISNLRAMQKDEIAAIKLLLRSRMSNSRLEYKTQTVSRGRKSPIKGSEKEGAGSEKEGEGSLRHDQSRVKIFH